jgi:hypothetical protein
VGGSAEFSTTVGKVGLPAWGVSLTAATSVENIPNVPVPVGLSVNLFYPTFEQTSFSQPNYILSLGISVPGGGEAMGATYGYMSAPDYWLGKHH